MGKTKTINGDNYILRTRDILRPKSKDFFPEPIAPEQCVKNMLRHVKVNISEQSECICQCPACYKDKNHSKCIFGRCAFKPIEQKSYNGTPIDYGAIEVMQDGKRIVR
jgi:hypothetical protein